MAFVTHPWQVFALRALLGLLTGYGGLTLSMAAESAPPGRMAAAIGTVQTAQRLGPAIGPVIGGVLAGVVGLRQTFLVASVLYGAALLLVFTLYDERAVHVQPAAATTERVGVRTVLRLDNFVLLMGVMFALQFVDRSFGPILPLYLEQLGTPHERVAPAAGLLFSVAALSGATGHHFCGRLLQRYRPMTVIAGAAATTATGAALMALAATVPAGAAWVMAIALAVFGLAIGTASTATYTAAGSIIPGGSHATGFGLMSSASLTGLAISPIVSGVLADVSMPGIFALDVAIMVTVGLVASRQLHPSIAKP
jgi:DHA1 family multidrug resistance protein-like MFS transporter